METPIAMRWKISKREMRKELVEENFLCKSYYFTEPCGIGYKLYVKYDKRKDKVIIGLGISMKHPITITADFSISTIKICFILNSDFTKSGQWAGKSLCTFDNLFDPAYKLFIDGYFLIKMEGILRFEKERIDSTITNSNSLGEALWNRDNKDFDIYVDEKSIKIHKCIVGTRSSVFERMFQSGMKESAENKVAIIDFDFGTVEIAMKFCYGMEITHLLNVSEEKPQSLTLGDFLWQRYDRDFVIAVGKEGEDTTEIKIHKCVLASRSPVFDAMLQADMKEKAKNRLEIIDFHVEVVQAAVDYFYDRDTFKFLTLNQLINLIQFSDKYDIKDFKRKIDYAFLPHLSPGTVCQIANAAITSNSSVLKDLCFQTILTYLKQGIPFADSEILDKDFVTEMLKKASSDYNF